MCVDKYTNMYVYLQYILYIYYIFIYYYKLLLKIAENVCGIKCLGARETWFLLRSGQTRGKVLQIFTCFVAELTC